VKTCAMMRKGMELNKYIGRKSLHHFVQRSLVRSFRQQVAKPQVLMTSQQNCSKQEERQYWTEYTEYVWQSGKLVSGQIGYLPLGPGISNFWGLSGSPNIPLSLLHLIHILIICCSAHCLKSGGNSQCVLQCGRLRVPLLDF